MDSLTEFFLLYESGIGLIIYCLLMIRLFSFYNFEFILDLFFIVALPFEIVIVFLKNSSVGCSCSYFLYDLNLFFLLMTLLLISFFKALYIYFNVHFKKAFILLFIPFIFFDLYFIREQLNFRFIDTLYSFLKAHKQINPNFNYSIAATKFFIKIVSLIINLCLIPILFISRTAFYLNANFEKFEQLKSEPANFKYILLLYLPLIIFFAMKLLTKNTCSGF